jgi:hypothetical protein
MYDVVEKIVGRNASADGEKKQQGKCVFDAGIGAERRCRHRSIS